MTYRQFSNESFRAAKKAGIKNIITQNCCDGYKLLANNGTICYNYVIPKTESLSDFRSFVQDLF